MGWVDFRVGGKKSCTLSMGPHLASEAHSLENVPWSFRMELDAKFKAFFLICVLNTEFSSSTGNTRE